mmetsp:Transcript_48036/g.134097  ORF Transcript_48036/g.134097 Transcript_48036/m.134097 type:complete len:301 (+) Transcript_48036:43-945(+)
MLVFSPTSSASTRLAAPSPSALALRLASVCDDARTARHRGELALKLIDFRLQIFHFVLSVAFGLALPILRLLLVVPLHDHRVRGVHPIQGTSDRQGPVLVVARIVSRCRAEADLSVRRPLHVADVLTLRADEGANAVARQVARHRVVEVQCACWEVTRQLAQFLHSRHRRAWFRVAAVARRRAPTTARRRPPVPTGTSGVATVRIVFGMALHAVLSCDRNHLGVEPIHGGPMPEVVGIRFLLDESVQPLQRDIDYVRWSNDPRKLVPIIHLILHENASPRLLAQLLDVRSFRADQLAPDE